MKKLLIISLLFFAHHLTAMMPETELGFEGAILVDEEAMPLLGGMAVPDLEAAVDEEMTEPDGDESYEKPVCLCDDLIGHRKWVRNAWLCGGTVISIGGVAGSAYWLAVSNSYEAAALVGGTGACLFSLILMGWIPKIIKGDFKCNSKIW